jgi:phosphohistidine phosphatase
MCSTARRARATARPVVEALHCPVRYEHALYEADADDLLDIVHGLPDHVTNAMLVGHNPSLEELAELLCGSSPPFPTAALGTIALTAAGWRDVTPGSGALIAHVTPAELDAATS